LNRYVLITLELAISIYIHRWSPYIEMHQHVSTVALNRQTHFVTMLFFKQKS